MAIVMVMALTINGGDGDGVGDGGDDDGVGDGGDILKLLSGGRLACQMDEDSTALLLAFGTMIYDDDDDGDDDKDAENNEDSNWNI